MTTDRCPLTIHEAAAAVRSGTLSLIDLLEQCLTRVDRYEPAVRAWVVVDRDRVRKQAEKLTDELKDGRDRGPLHGVPLGVKDIIDVAGLPTGCGSTLRASAIARRDAGCVRKLRQAGVVVVGKTVTTPFAYLDPPATRNPWDLNRTPGGSSSGSAAAVACGMCLAALGTQTVGSLTRPASYCGLCSFKPAVEDAGADGVLPLAPTLDHVGVMARCVRDLAIIAGGLDLPPHVPRFVTVNGFDDRIEPAMGEAMARVCELVKPTERALPPAATDLPRYLRAILATEAAAFHGARLRRQTDDYPPKIRELVEEGLHVPPADYQAALAHRESLRTEFDRVLFGDGAALLTPATLGPAPDRLTTGDAVFNAPWSYVGFPTISLPIGRTEDGLPLAAQLVGRPGEVAALFAAAVWLEARLGFELGLPAVVTPQPAAPPPAG